MITLIILFVTSLGFTLYCHDHRHRKSFTLGAVITSAILVLILLYITPWLILIAFGFALYLVLERKA